MNFLHIFRSKFELALFICITTVTLILVSPRFFSQIIRIPKDHVFVGMTVYFEDFYYYLDAFRQGADGNWLVENKFSSEKFPATLVYLPDLIMGKIGGLFGLESFQSYNLFALLFKLCFIVSSYVMLTKLFPKSSSARLYAFLIFLYSTSLPSITFNDGKLIFNGAIDVFRAENRVMARFGSSPQGMLQNLLFIVRLMLAVYYLKSCNKNHEADVQQQAINWSKITLVCIFIASIIGSLIDATKAVVLLVVVGIVGLLYYHTHKNTVSFRSILYLLLAIAVPLICMSIYLGAVVQSDPVFKIANDWDVKEYYAQFQTTKFLGTIAGFGLILPFFLIGYISNFKKSKSIYELIAFLISSSCIVLYVIPYVLELQFPAFRFIFPATYVFLAYYAYLGMQFITWITKSSFGIHTLMTIYLCFNLFTYFTAWWIVVQPIKEPDYHFAYVPDKLFEGFKVLRNLEPKDGIVLASPHTAMDLMIPGLGSKYTYTGHFLVTYNSKTKDDLANKFFYEWTDTPETHDFLNQNKIQFVIVTKYDQILDTIKNYYPFLKVEYENDMITIFRYNPA